MNGKCMYTILENWRRKHEWDLHIYGLTFTLSVVLSSCNKILVSGHVGF